MKQTVEEISHNPLLTGTHPPPPPSLSLSLSGIFINNVHIKHQLLKQHKLLLLLFVKQFPARLGRRALTRGSLSMALTERMTSPRGKVSGTKAEYCWSVNTGGWKLRVMVTTHTVVLKLNGVPLSRARMRI